MVKHTTFGTAISEDTAKALGGGEVMSQEMSTEDWIKDKLRQELEICR